MASAAKIPVSVIVVTRNEERRIERCLSALADFAEIIVVDSGSSDRTKEIAARFGKVVDFAWNGQYPKKRQWCLDHLQLAHDWVFFVDADEIVTEKLKEEIRGLDFNAAGYFVPGLYIFEGAKLRFGLRNNKLALIDRRKMAFPVVDDLGAPGMGEIEGHYQPRLRQGFGRQAGEGKIGQMKAALLHDAFHDEKAWQARHERYAAWEREMNRKKAWPGDARVAKQVFRVLPARPLVAFLHCYIVKLGFLDGGRGFRFARSRYQYYRMI